MWCSRQNGKIMFYLGVMLVIVGLGLVLMKENLVGAVIMCIGVFPLAIGFLVIITHLRIDDTMGKKRRPKKSEPIPEKPIGSEPEKEPQEEDKVH